MDFDSLNFYNGDTEHDMWLYFDNYENTGTPDVFDEPASITLLITLTTGIK